MTINTQTESHAAFKRILADLGEIADKHLGPDKGYDEEIQIVEGLRNALHLLSAATDFYLEGDPDRPEFVKIVSPTRKLMGDNPDAIYHFSRVSGNRTYRVRGKRCGECYLSFTVHGRSKDGRLGAAAEPVLADINDRNIEIASDGSYELIFSSKEHPGNWVELDPTASSLLVRHYFENEENAACDPSIEVKLEIESLDEVGMRPPLDDASMATKLNDVAAFVRGATLDTIDPTTIDIPFVSLVPNELPLPSIFRVADSDTWGAVDIAYAMGPFELKEGQALLMEGILPECAFANVVLWNKSLQCLEFRDRCVSLNRKQIALRPDGTYRIIIADRDPGLPNWLDTEGHRTGTIFWRILLPEGQPARPECRVVAFSDLEA